MCAKMFHSSNPYHSTGRVIWPQPTVLNEPVGISIRQIEVIQDPNVDSRFPVSGNWMPPSRAQDFKTVEEIRYNVNHVQNADQASKFIWTPRDMRYDTVPAVDLMPAADEYHWKQHRCATLIWSSQHHTFLHVPQDCTTEDVEDSENGGPFENVTEDGDEHDGLNWKRLSFYHKYPRPDVPCISLARHGNALCVEGILKRSWADSLVSTVHRSLNQHGDFGQLAGELPILFGLVAACSLTRTRAYQAIEDWFPPSHGESSWDQSVQAMPPMRRASESEYDQEKFASIVSRR